MAVPFRDASQKESGPVYLPQNGAGVPLCGHVHGSSTPPIACFCFFFLRAEVGANRMVLELRRCKGM